MKKILFLISTMGFTACSTYTVENKTSESIKAGEVEVAAGKCVELSEFLFGLMSDFPITFTKADGTDLTNGKDKEAAHYVVDASGVKESETACEVEEEDDDDTENTGNEDTTPPTQDDVDAPSNDGSGS